MPAPAPASTRPPLARRLAHALRGGDGSGPLVARLFHRLLALIFLIAWLSLGAQIDVLIGRRGLLPAAPFFDAAAAQRLAYHELPSLFRWGAGDAALHAGIAAGVALSIASLLGLAPRLCALLQLPLYLSYAVACRSFLGFQWDNLLLECGLLAVFLPRDPAAYGASPNSKLTPGRVAHALLRVALFKLYFESGVAKWQSPLHDWHDGSAMTFYYETAPLPTRWAWFAHALPTSWHHFESWFTLFFELALPFAIFGPRPARLVALAVFTGFQLVNISTANYGFFAYLAIALHVSLLDDRDLVRARAFVECRLRLRRLRARLRLAHRRLRRASLHRALASFPRARLALALAFATFYVGASFIEAVAHFGHFPAFAGDTADLRALYTPYRVVNVYHLFSAITRERVEPEFQTSDDGVTWIAHDLAYKPGDPTRAPPIVAPHQPRVDFLLWFYGLSYRRGVPTYVGALLERLCHDPPAVQPLFPAPLPPSPAAARIAFYRYHFTTPAERRAGGAWWRREQVGASRPLPCR